MFTIRLSEVARCNVKAFTKRDQRIIMDSIAEQLSYEPQVKTRSRKPLRENPLAAWELRVQEFPVLYNVDEDEAVVYVAAIAVKEGNKYLIEGEEYPL